MSKTGFIDLVGKRSGRLLVIDRAENGKNGQARWNCICDCGGTTVAYGAPLRSGVSKSCGCLQRETARQVLSVVNTTHGESRTPRYNMWCSAKRRAARDGVPFGIEFRDFPQIPEKCPALGIPLKVNLRRGPCGNSPTLDKIVPSLGYVAGNIQIISHRANTIKSDATAAEIMAVANYVVANTMH